MISYAFSWHYFNFFMYFDVEKHTINFTNILYNNPSPSYLSFLPDLLCDSTDLI